MSSNTSAQSRDPTSTESPWKAIRSCDGCTMCCKVFTIVELEKPRGSWCPHCDIGVGCRIYEKRPVACSGFQCGYLVEPNLNEAWKPNVSRLVISLPAPNYWYIHVDPKQPDAWRREPYYSAIKRWTKEALELDGQVAIFVGTRAWVALPDRDVDLGVFGADDMIVVEKTFASRGVVYAARLVNKNDSTIRESPKLPFSMTPLESDWLRVRSTFRRS